MVSQRTSFFNVFLIVTGLASYQLALCYLNTHGMGVTNSLLAIAEGGLLMLAIATVIRHMNFSSFAFPALIIAYFILLWLVRGAVDPQGLRNVLIIYVMFSLGVLLADIGKASLLAWMISLVVLFFACFEFFYTQQYLTWFDILHYYSARGMVTEEQLGYLNTNLFISGMRPGGRTLLPSLGDQRVSSLFLEPVSMGNFATILCMWALSYNFKEWKKSFGIFALGCVFIIASDSRFASLMVFLLMGVRLLPVLQLPFLLYLLPVLCIAGQAYFASLHIADSRMDDLPGRLAKAGEALHEMSIENIFGNGNIDELYDMGIPYSLVVFGAILCVLLWTRLVTLKFPTTQGHRLRAMVCYYCLGLLMISGASFYSSKTAGLLWVLMGVLYVQNEKEKSNSTPDSDVVQNEQTATTP